MEERALTWVHLYERRVVESKMILDDRLLYGVNEAVL
jgi:hypothetical protein